MIILIIAILSAYLLGSIPASYIIAKVFRGIDVRKHGSGNVGATNVLRTAGKGPAILALTCDILKGVLAVTALSRFFYRFSIITDYESLQILLGFVAIAGHIWSVFLRFKGGKGVATSAGVLLILCPKALGIAGIVWFGVVIISKYVSLASISASIALPIVVALQAGSIRLVVFTITLCLISCYKHRSNIIRLINGEEARIGERAKPPKS